MEKYILEQLKAGKVVTVGSVAEHYGKRIPQVYNELCGMAKFSVEVTSGGDLLITLV